MLFSRFEIMQSDPGDSRFNHYVMEHTYRWLAGDALHQDLWNPPFFYPQKNVLAYSDTLLSAAPPYWLMRAGGLPANPAFGWWMIVMAAANYVAAYCFLRHGIRREILASVFGAWLIAFSSSRIAQLTHHQLFIHFYTISAIHALFVLFGHRSVSPKGRRVWWMVFFGCFVAQFYAGYYFGFFLFLCLGLALFGAISVRSMRAHVVTILRRDRYSILVVGGLAFLLISPLAFHYILVAQELGVRGVEKAGLPRLASFVWMGSSNWLYGWTHKWAIFRDLPLVHEQAVGIGLLTSCVIAWYFIRQRTTWSARIFLTVILLTIVFCCVFPGNLTLFRVWYYAIPGIQGVRVMARVGLLLAIPAGLALAWLIETHKGRRFMLPVMGLAVLCCLEQIHEPRNHSPQDDDIRVASIVRGLKDGATGSPFYVVPKCGEPVWRTQIDAMWAGLELARPTINGYSGNFPLEYDLYRPEDAKVDSVLHAWSSRHSGLEIEVLREIHSDTTASATVAESAARIRR